MWGSANPRKVLKLWNQNKIDFGLGLITGLIVLGFDLLPAMITGIVLSIIYLVYRVSFPARAELGRDSTTGDFRALGWVHGATLEKGDPDAEPIPGVIVYRFAAPLVFSTAQAFKGSAEQLLIDAGAKGPLPHTLIIDCEEMFYADVSGASALHGLKAFTDRYGVRIALARLHTHARQALTDDGVLAEIGADRVYPTVHAAVAAAASS